MKLIGYYTEKGRELAAKLLTGTSLRITRVAAGDRETSLSEVSMVSEKQALMVSPLRRNGMTVTLPVTLSAALAEGDYTLKEVGVYAREGEEEVLYRVYRLTQSLDIASDQDLIIRFDLQETVSETAEVTVDGTAGLLTETERGAPSGVAALDENGLVPVGQLPYTWGTEELEAGVTGLATGRLHFVYE